MANTKHIDLLRQGKEIWNDWREDHPEEVVDLSEAKLMEKNLSGYILHKVNFSRADLTGSHLYQVDLSEANLTDAILRKINLSLSELTKANLSHADLSESNISKAILTEAKLHRSNLSGAKLVEATLISTYLAFTNFAGADLQSADLAKATLAFTMFGNANLKDVCHLDTCNHKAPSIIDQMTLLKAPNLSKDFLRGCGLSDAFIRSIPSLFWSPESDDFFSCFISYSHDDIEFARKLHNKLQDHGIRCWRDEIALAPGDDIHDAIERGILNWDKVLLCCSKSSLEKSWWVDSELEKALQKEQQLFRQRGKKVLVLIPLNLDNYIFSDWQSGKKSDVKSRVAADFTGWTDNRKFDAEFEKLLRALRPNRDIIQPPPKPKL